MLEIIFLQRGGQAIGDILGSMGPVGLIIGAGILGLAGWYNGRRLYRWIKSKHVNNGVEGS